MNNNITWHNSEAVSDFIIKLTTNEEYKQYFLKCELFPWIGKGQLINNICELDYILFELTGNLDISYEYANIEFTNEFNMNFLDLLDSEFDDVRELAEFIQWLNIEIVNYKDGETIEDLL